MNAATVNATNINKMYAHNVNKHNGQREDNLYEIIVDTYFSVGFSLKCGTEAKIYNGIIKLKLFLYCNHMHGLPLSPEEHIHFHTIATLFC